MVECSGCSFGGAGAADAASRRGTGASKDGVLLLKMDSLPHEVDDDAERQQGSEEGNGALSQPGVP